MLERAEGDNLINQVLLFAMAPFGTPRLGFCILRSKKGQNIDPMRFCEESKVHKEVKISQIKRIMFLVDPRTNLLRKCSGNNVESRLVAVWRCGCKTAILNPGWPVETTEAGLIVMFGLSRTGGSERTSSSRFF